MIGNQIAGFFSVGAPPVPPTNFESIATVTASGTQSSITFSSIPSTYKHLQIRGIQHFTIADAEFGVQFNSDTGNNYARHNLYGTGSAVTASATASTSFASGGIAISTTASYFGATVIDILDYANTNKYKTSRVLSGSDANGSGYIWLRSGLWQNTAAINSITLTGISTSFTQYSQFALYGITGA